MLIHIQTSLLSAFLICYAAATANQDIRMNLSWLHAIRNNMLQTSINFTSAEPTTVATADPSLVPTTIVTSEPTLTTTSSSSPPTSTSVSTSLSPTVTTTLEPTIATATTIIPSLPQSSSPSQTSTFEPTVTTSSSSLSPSLSPTQEIPAYIRVNSYRDLNCTELIEVVYIAVGECIPGLSPPALRVNVDDSTGAIYLSTFADSYCTLQTSTSPVPSSQVDSCGHKGSIFSVQHLAAIPSPPFAAADYLEVRAYVSSMSMPSQTCTDSASLVLQINTNHSCWLPPVPPCVDMSSGWYSSIFSFSRPVNGTLGCVVLPTSAPTSKPTFPSALPTSLPTLPTALPTTGPTTPTTEPTTASPTVIPSLIPTLSPSSSSQALHVQIIYYTDDTCTTTRFVLTIQTMYCIPMSGFGPNVNSFVLTSVNGQSYMYMFSDNACQHYLSFSHPPSNAFGVCGALQHAAVFNLSFNQSAPVPPFGNAVYTSLSVYSWYYAQPMQGCDGSAALLFQYPADASSCDLLGLTGCFLTSASPFSAQLNLTLPLSATITCLNVLTAQPSQAPTLPTIEPSVAPSLPTLTPSKEPTSWTGAAFFQSIMYADNACTVPVSTTVYSIYTCLPVDVGVVPGAKAYYMYCGSVYNSITIIAYSDSECHDYMTELSLSPNSFGVCDNGKIMNTYGWLDFPSPPFASAPYLSVRASRPPFEAYEPSSCDPNEWPFVVYDQILENSTSCEIPPEYSGCFDVTMSPLQSAFNFTTSVNASASCVYPSAPSVEPSSFTSISYLQVINYADDACTYAVSAIVYSTGNCLPMNTGLIPGALSYIVYSGTSYNSAIIVAYSDSECRNYMTELGLYANSMGVCNNGIVMNTYGWLDFPSPPFASAPYLSVSAYRPPLDAYESTSCDSTGWPLVVYQESLGGTAFCQIPKEYSGCFDASVSPFQRAFNFTVSVDVTASCVYPPYTPTATPTMWTTPSSLVFTSLPTTVQSILLPVTEPNVSPSQNPSFEPSLLPSFNPSMEPTLNPSSVPSIPPTASPTCGPTSSPSVDPTGGPSVTPSATPTDGPTSTPSKRPTQKPLIPSSEPSFKPTTESPSYEYSSFPTKIPSKAPVRKPPTAPTPVKTRSPTAIPSVAPTALTTVCTKPITRIPAGYQSAQFTISQTLSNITLSSFQGAHGANTSLAQAVQCLLYGKLSLPVQVSVSAGSASVSVALPEGVNTGSSKSVTVKVTVTYYYLNKTTSAAKTYYNVLTSAVTSSVSSGQLVTLIHYYAKANNCTLLSASTPSSLQTPVFSAPVPSSSVTSAPVSRSPAGAQSSSSSGTTLINGISDQNLIIIIVAVVGGILFIFLNVYLYRRRTELDRKAQEERWISGEVPGLNVVKRYSTQRAFKRTLDPEEEFAFEVSSRGSVQPPHPAMRSPYTMQKNPQYVDRDMQRSGMVSPTSAFPQGRGYEYGTRSPARFEQGPRSPTRYAQSPYDHPPARYDQNYQPGPSAFYEYEKQGYYDPRTMPPYDNYGPPYSAPYGYYPDMPYRGDVGNQSYQSYPEYQQADEPPSGSPSSQPRSASPTNKGLSAEPAATSTDTTGKTVAVSEEGNKNTETNIKDSK